jgi:hypothetical protein
MTPNTQQQAPVAVSQYLADKIDRGVNFIETRALEIDRHYLAQIEKLAQRTSDPVWAEFFRGTVRPGSIASAIRTIRFYLRIGQIAEADMALDRLRRRLDLVEEHLTQPIFRMGSRFYGERGPRRDALTRLIDEALNELGPRASAREVLNHIRDASPGLDIDSDGAIFWRNARRRERTTTFKAFQNRLTHRRRLFSQSG